MADRMASPAAFRHRLRVRYGETDAQGVVFFANYLLYFDTAITEWLRSIGWDYRSHIASGFDFHVVRALAEYKAPIRFDDEIDVAVRIDRLGTSSITWRLSVHAAGAVDAAATGEVVWVHADQATKRSAPLPPELRVLIGTVASS